MNVRDTIQNAGRLDPNVNLRIEKDPPGAASQMLIPGPYNGNDIVQFDKQMVGFSRWLYENNVHVRNAVNTFRKHVLKSGVVIDVEVCGKKFRFNQEDKENIDYYTNVLLPGIERIIVDWILCGYSIVRVFQPSEKEKFPYFAVLRDHVTEEYIEWVDDRRQYKLYYSQGIPGPKAGNPVPGGHILRLHDPTDNGKPNSELITVLEPLARSDFMWSQYINSVYYNSHPPFIYAPEPNKGGEALAAKVGVWGGNAYLKGAANAKKDDKVDVTLGELAVALSRSIHTQEYVPPRISASAMEESSASSISENVAAPMARIVASIDNAPWENGKTSEAGHRLQTAPRSTAPEKFLEIQENIVHQIYRAIGIPPEMLSSTHQKHAANVEQTTAELRTNVIEFQGKARSQLAFLFTELFSQLIDSKICAEATSKGRDKDVAYLRYEKVRAKVDFQFEYNPIITPELLFSYHDQGIIRPEKFQEFALLIAGMPQDAKEPDLEKAMQRKLDMQAKAKAKASPNNPGGPSGSSGSKGTKSSSSSSSSSSKSSSSSSSASSSSTKKQKTGVNNPSSSSSGRQSSEKKPAASSSSSSLSSKKENK